MASNPNIEDHTERLSFRGSTAVAYQASSGIGEVEDHDGAWKDYNGAGAYGGVTNLPAGSVQYIGFSLTTATSARTLTQVLTDQSKTLGDVKAVVVHFKDVVGFTGLDITLNSVEISHPFVPGWPIGCYTGGATIPPEDISFTASGGGAKNKINISLTCILDGGF